MGWRASRNDETNFLFAVDSGVLEHEQPSGELVLRVQVAILGEETYLHRFSYQIAAHARRARAQTSGVIAVPTDIRDVIDLSPADLNAAFEITANRVERGGVRGGFAFDKLIPMQVGATTASRTARSSRCSSSTSTSRAPAGVARSAWVRWPAAVPSRSLV